jgi:hypothetical protein
MRIAEALAAESRKFKIHLIIGAGRATRAELGLLPTSLSNKFVGYVPTARDSAFLAGPGLQCHRLTGKGDFLHIAPHKTERFQVALTTPADLARLDRGEIKPFSAPDPAAPSLPETLSPPAGGRPRQTIRPEIVATYLIAQNELSIPQAKALFNLKRTGHTLHKRFTTRLLAELTQAGWQLTQSEKME